MDAGSCCAVITFAVSSASTKFDVTLTASVRVGRVHVPAAGRDLQCRVPADAAPGADDEDDLAAEFLLGRHPSQLRVLERPVLDAERLAPWKRDVVMECRAAVFVECDGARH